MCWSSLLFFTGLNTETPGRAVAAKERQSTMFSPITDHDILVFVESTQKVGMLRYWQKVAQNLGFNAGPLRFIKDPRDDYQCMMDVLYEFKRLEPEGSGEDLISAVKHLYGFTEVADQLFHHYRSLGKSNFGRVTRIALNQDKDRSPGGETFLE